MRTSASNNRSPDIARPPAQAPLTIAELFQNIDNLRGISANQALLRKECAGLLNRGLQLAGETFTIQDGIAAGAGGAVFLADPASKPGDPVALKISHPFLLREMRPSERNRPPSTERHDYILGHRLAMALEYLTLQSAEAQKTADSVLPHFHGSWEVGRSETSSVGLRVTAMEFIKGPTLEEFIRKSLFAEENPKQALSAVAATARAVRTLLHADLYCADSNAGNFIISQQGSKIATRVIDLECVIPKVGHRLLCPAGFQTEPAYKNLLARRPLEVQQTLQMFQPEGALMRDLRAAFSTQEMARQSIFNQGMACFSPKTTTLEDLNRQTINLEKFLTTLP